MILEQKTKSTSNANAILIAAGILFFYLLIAGQSTLWDRDEPRYARATVEMIESGNWLVPTLNGKIWFDKPILIYWMMAIPVKLFGPTEIACRFFAALGTSITCLLTFFIGKRLFDARVGLWAEIISATTLLTVAIGSLAIVDGILLPLIVGQMAIMIRWYDSKIRVIDVIVVGVLMGLGMLAKGPGGIMPAIAMVPILWFSRKNFSNFIKAGVWLSIAVIIGAVIFLTWAIPANNASNGLFVKNFIGERVFSWATTSLHGHGGNFFLFLPYYFPITIFCFFPWVMFLPGAISVLKGGRMGDRKSQIILTAWGISIFILITLMKTKLPHYALFIWPVFSIATAAVVFTDKDKFTVWDRKWLRGGIWFFVVPAVMLAVGVIVGPWFTQPIPILRIGGAISGAVLLIITVISIRLQLKEEFVKSAKVLLVGMFVVAVPILFGLLPGLEQMKITPPLARAIVANTTADTAVAACDFSEPSLNFYISRNVKDLDDEDGILKWIKERPGAILIIPENRLAEILKNNGPLPLYEIASKNGYNYSYGKDWKILVMRCGEKK